MQLTGDLELESVALLGMAVRPTAGEPRVTLAMESEFTPGIACLFGCEEAVFTADGLPRSGVKSLDLDACIEETRAIFHSAKRDGQTIICHPLDISHLRVVRGEDDEELRLRFRITVDGYASGFCDLINESHDSLFDMVLQPNQVSIDFSSPGTPAISTTADQVPDDSPDTTSDAGDDKAFLDELGIGDGDEAPDSQPPTVKNVRSLRSKGTKPSA